MEVLLSNVTGSPRTCSTCVLPCGEPILTEKQINIMFVMH